MASAKFFVPIELAGPTGATAATRYAGATASGAPASGSFLKGDFVIDQTGSMWVCTATGSPGTWVEVAGGGGGVTYGTPAVALGTAAAAGSTDEAIRRDSTIVAFDATAPSTQAFGDSAATGSAAVAARRDHKHAMPAVSAYAQTLLDDADAATARATLGVNPFRPRLPQSLLSTAIAEAMDRSQVQVNVALLSSGRLSLVSIPVLADDVLSAISFNSATTGLSGQTHWWFALTDESFNVIRQSRNQLTGAWSANTLQTLTVDEVPVTAGSRVASSTVTLTFPTLSQPLSALFAVGDSIVVSNANIAAYNGTFTIATVTATQITYVSGGSATDTLSAPFPTVQPAAGKRVYTVPASGLVYAVIMIVGTVPTLMGSNYLSAASSASPRYAGNGNSGLTGTCPSPVAPSGGVSVAPWAAVS